MKRGRFFYNRGLRHFIQQFTAYCSLLALAVSLSCCNQSPHTNVTIDDTQWRINGEPVLKGSPAEGLLMNARMVNAVFEDANERATELPRDFDSEANTDRFIEQIRDYYAHGVRAFTVGLQGGMPGYEGAINTAFNKDGSLRPPYLSRVSRVIRAADKEGAIVILSCFYQRQHSHAQALDGKQAILNAVRNVAKWIVDEQYKNVIIEVSNEYSHGGYSKWKDGEWLKSVEGQVELIRTAKDIAPTLLISTSGMGNGRIAQPIAEAVDFIVLHFNRTPLDLIPERIKEAQQYGKPVICNEDDKIGRIGAEAARLSVLAGAGWGFMHIDKNQLAPFEFDGAHDDTIVYNMLSRLATPGEPIETLSAELFSVLITQPIDGDVIDDGTPVTIRAELSGFEGAQQVQVQFLAADKLIGKCTAPPWEFRWEDPPAGKYDVHAVVRGAKGELLLSSGAVDFEVRATRRAAL